MLSCEDRSILQVREQSKLNAAKLRQSVNDEKERLLRELAEQLQVCLPDFSATG